MLFVFHFHSISGPPDKQLLTKLEIETIMGLMPGNNTVTSASAWGSGYGYDQYGYGTGYAAQGNFINYLFVVELHITTIHRGTLRRPE